MMALDKEDSKDRRILEKWLEGFFLDPFISFLDQTQFRIDLFETDSDLIVEALLSGINSSDISVFVDNRTLIIKAHPLQSDKGDLKIRTVEFPFTICEKEISATFMEGILEIFISKKNTTTCKPRFVTLP